MSNSLQCPKCRSGKIIKLGYSGPLQKRCMCKDCKDVFNVEDVFVEKMTAEKCALISSEEMTLQEICERFILGNKNEFDINENKKRADFVTDVMSHGQTVYALLREVAKYEYRYMEQTYKD